MNALHETQGQAALWAVFMLSGSFCALLTDLIRLLALPCHANGGEHAPIIPYKNAYGIPLPDFPAAGALCGAVSALIAAGTCFFTANGRLRPYMLLAMAAGAALYHATVGHLLRRIFRFCRRILGALCPRVASCRAVRAIFK